jgi:cation diffusion facilitator family transporter
LWSTLGLGFFKLYIGIISGSHALMASAFCSLTDVASAISIIASNNITNKPVNAKYPYGYGKVEFVVSMMVSLCIVLSTIFLFVSSFLLIVRKIHVAPHFVAFFAAIIGSILSGIKYRFAKCVARELDSPAIQAHAAHNKTDSITAIFVALGVLFARLGLGFLDPLIAIFETAHVLFSSGEVFTNGVRGLLDMSVSHEKLLKIENASRKVERVKAVSKIRARQT